MSEKNVKEADPSPAQATTAEEYASGDAENVEVGKDDMPTTTSREADAWPNKSLVDSVLICLFRYDQDSFIFALRLAVTVGLSSILICCFPPDKLWPEGVWVYTTVCIITWQERSDTANIFKKTFERICGTLVGGLIGLAIGFLSLETPTETGQALVIGFALPLYSFLYAYYTARAGWRSNYGASLGNMTFGLVLVAFFYQAQTTQDPWTAGVYRIINILIGCVFALATALIVWPLSSRMLLAALIEKQMKAVGISAERVMDEAVASLSGQRVLPLLEEIQIKKNDSVHSDLLKHMDTWKSCQALFPALRFSPWFRSMPVEERDKFTTNMAVRLSRIFRIQTNLVMLDAMARTKVNYQGSNEAFLVLRRVGKKISHIMDITTDSEYSSVVVHELVERDLVWIHEEANRLRQSAVGRTMVLQPAEILKDLARFEGGLPVSHLDSSMEQSITFLELVAQLILRVAQLHLYRLQYEPSLTKRH